MSSEPRDEAAGQERAEAVEERLEEPEAEADRGPEHGAVGEAADRRTWTWTTPDAFSASSMNGAITRTRKNVPAVEPPFRKANSGPGYCCETAEPRSTMMTSRIAATIVAPSAP